MTAERLAGVVSENVNRDPITWPSTGATPIERAAIFVYEAARLHADAMRMPDVVIPPPWSQREEAFRTQFLKVTEVMCGPDRMVDGPAVHASWVHAYEQMGWVYGPARVTGVTHPDMVPWDALSLPNQYKDLVFVALSEIARRWVVDIEGTSR